MKLGTLITPWQDDPKTRPIALVYVVGAIKTTSLIVSYGVHRVTNLVNWIVFMDQIILFLCKKT